MSKRVALVTGAAKGMGLEWCRQLSLEGFTVLLTARSMEKADAAAAELRAQGLDVIGEVLDMDNEISMAELASRITSRFARLDLLINNAGINSKDDPDKSRFAKSYRLDELDPEEMMRHIRTNAVMPVVLVKHMRPLLNKGEKPVVLSVSSWLGSIGSKTSGGHYSYTTSKAALNMLNRGLAFELQAEGITCVVCNPGWVRTDMGGQKAPLSMEESVGGMLRNVVARVGPTDTGKFFQWDGTEHAW